MAINSFSNGNFINSLQAAGKNAVINGGMDIWQRGTSIALAASTNYLSGFSTDRWQTGTGANQAITISRQATSDTTNLPFIQYCARYQRNSGQTGTGTLTFAQSFESANSVPLAGRAVTLSFYARAGANYSAASSTLFYQVYSGTGTDQNIFSGSYTGAVAAINSSATLTTTWQRFTATATLATNTNELAVQFQYVPVGTAGANDYYEITGVQLELGSYATTYTRSAATIQGELAACQRYLPAISEVNQYSGAATGTTSSRFSIPYPVTARVAPTGISTTALSTFLVQNQALASAAPTIISFTYAGNANCLISATTTAGSPTLVTGQPAQFFINTGGLLLFTGCEL